MPRRKTIFLQALKSKLSCWCQLNTTQIQSVSNWNDFEVEIEWPHGNGTSRRVPPQHLMTYTKQRLEADTPSTAFSLFECNAGSRRQGLYRHFCFLCKLFESGAVRWRTLHDKITTNRFSIRLRASSINGSECAESFSSVGCPLMDFLLVFFLKLKSNGNTYGNTLWDYATFQ